MNEMKKINVMIFEDTKSLCENNIELKTAIQNSTSKQYIVNENDVLKITGKHRFKNEATILVTKSRTMAAARRYIGQKVCIHNFASALNPGGGVIKGAIAQEEAICRCSTLYFNIKNASAFYNSHKRMIKKGEMNDTYNDDCIYTPKVVVFKSDEYFPQLLSQEQWYNVDVITCAAPNLREKENTNVKLTNEELENLHIKRTRRILDIAKQEKEDVIILGAFGCGAFANPPEVVAKAMKQVVEEYKYDFKTIEFAVYCTIKDMRNYEVFKDVLQSN